LGCLCLGCILCRLCCDFFLHRAHAATGHTLGTAQNQCLILNAELRYAMLCCFVLRCVALCCNVIGCALLSDEICSAVLWCAVHCWSVCWPARSLTSYLTKTSNDTASILHAFNDLQCTVAAILQTLPNYLQSWLVFHDCY
jgi:hypothetical protein